MNTLNLRNSLNTQIKKVSYDTLQIVPNAYTEIKLKADGTIMNVEHVDAPSIINICDNLSTITISGIPGPKGSTGTASFDRYLGTWDISTEYQIGDMCYYNGNLYITSIVSIGDAPDISSNWNPLLIETIQGDVGPQGPAGPQGIQGPIGPRGLVGKVDPQLWRGDYDSSHIYYARRLVRYNNNIYISLIGPNQGNQPDISSTYWQLFIMEGPEGPMGPAINIAGSYSTEAELLAAHPDNNSIGDSYLVAGDLYVFTGSIFENVGNIQGPQGEVGPEGPEGPQGLQGPQGIQGPIGTIGLTGPIGNTGPQGPQGDVGPQGPEGPQGDIGPEGPEGPAGADSTVPGPQGLQGIQGEIGPQGLQGDIGPQGPQGDIGPEGPQGPQGDIGPQGPQGDTGPEGPQGDTGPQGLQGIQGPQGIQGIQGIQGDIGPGPLLNDLYIDSYTLQLTDAHKIIRMNATSIKTVTVPSNSSVSFPVGAVISVAQTGIAKVDIEPDTGVTIRTATSYRTRTQYSILSIVKVDTNEWYLSGDAE